MSAVGRGSARAARIYYAMNSVTVSSLLIKLEFTLRFLKAMLPPLFPLFIQLRLSLGFRFNCCVVHDVSILTLGLLP